MSRKFPLDVAFTTKGVFRTTFVHVIVDIRQNLAVVRKPETLKSTTST